MSPEEIADLVVPEYRAKGDFYYSCTGIIAKRWNAAYLAAELAGAKRTIRTDIPCSELYESMVK